MKKYLIILLLTSTSCMQNTKPELKSIPDRMLKNTASMQIPLSSLASSTDTICGMNLQDGIHDTLMFNNLVFGFCSHECKVAFREKLPNQ